MSRIRLLGPRDRLEEVVAALQDEGTVHLVGARPVGPLRRLEPDARGRRRARHLDLLLHDLDALAPAAPRKTPPPPPGAEPGLPQAARLARRLRRHLERLDRQRRDLEERRSEIARLEHFIHAFHGLLSVPDGSRLQSYHLVLRGEDDSVVARLREAVAGAIGDQFVLETRPLPTGERAAVLLVPRADAPRVERLLAQAGVHELPLPPAYAGRPLRELLPELAARRAELDAEREELERDHREAATALEDLLPIRGRVHDELSRLTARELAAVTPRSFLLEGWIPDAGLERLRSRLQDRFGAAVVVETVAREEWRGEEAPVVLRNPRLFQPFETLTRVFPLPRYGSIDPTPFVAVFFPMFFGLMLGDMGYGLMLGGLALWLRHRGGAGSTIRAVGEILGAAAAFSVAFGLAFGEFFGDLGTRWFGLRPLILNREHALLPFLGLAIAIGVVHVLLGLFLGFLNAVRGHPRRALGRGVALVMVALIVVALLAALEVLPGSFFTPVVIVLLAAFPLLVVLEGLIAPIEFLGTLSNILSYARIMALGTASVMMAIVANRLVGTFGSIVVGLLFGLLFHLVNFALGVFAPTIHGLRLHYVEFFGKFYSPGGVAYRPLGHWRGSGRAN